MYRIIIGNFKEFIERRYQCRSVYEDPTIVFEHVGATSSFEQGKDCYKKSMLRGDSIGDCVANVCIHSQRVCVICFIGDAWFLTK
jgi:hypothetical protein